MYYVYIFFSEKDKQLYTGFTNNLRSRYQAHANGYVKAAKDRRPMKLIYYEAYFNESDARRREKYLDITCPLGFPIFSDILEAASFCRYIGI